MAKATIPSVGKGEPQASKLGKPLATVPGKGVLGTGHICVIYKIATYAGPPPYSVYYAFECPFTPVQFISTNTNLPALNDGNCGNPASPNCVDVNFLLGKGDLAHVHPDLRNHGACFRFPERDTPAMYDDARLVNSYKVNIELPGGTRVIRAKLFEFLHPASDGNPAATFYHGIEADPFDAAPADGPIKSSKVSVNRHVCVATFRNHDYTVILQ